jgi:bifunctional DNase/RNase
LPLTEEKYTRVWFLNVVITGIPDLEGGTTGERVVMPTPAVLLKDSGKRVISIIVKKDEARIIKDVIEKNPDRPKIYELLVSILKKAHVEIKGAFVYNVRKWRYLTRLRLKMPGEDKVFELACRPSDALLVSILNDSPIYISNELMEEISIDTSEIPRQRK